MKIYMETVNHLIAGLIEEFEGETSTLWNEIVIPAVKESLEETKNSVVLQAMNADPLDEERECEETVDRLIGKLSRLINQTEALDATKYYLPTLFRAATGLIIAFSDYINREGEEAPLPLIKVQRLPDIPEDTNRIDDATLRLLASNPFKKRW